MKFIILWGLLMISATQVISESDPYATYGPAEKKCVIDNGLDVNVINRAFHGAAIDEGIEEVNTFMACSTPNLFDSDGQLNFEGLRGGIERAARKVWDYQTDGQVHDFYEGVKDECKNIKGDSHGDTAVKVHNCINNIVVYGFGNSRNQVYSK